MTDLISFTGLIAYSLGVITTPLFCLIAWSLPERDDDRNCDMEG